MWSLTLGNYISTNKLAATHSSTIRGLYGRADRLVVIQSPRPLVPSRGLLIDDLCLFSLLPVSESKLSTLQLLCPAMTRQDRENLVALATAGLINWEENAGEKRHRTLPLKKMVHPGLREYFFCGDGVACVTDVYGNLAVLMCCLEADTQVEEEVALAVLATMMEWRNRKEDWFLFGR